MQLNSHKPKSFSFHSLDTQKLQHKTFVALNNKFYQDMYTDINSINHGMRNIHITSMCPAQYVIYTKILPPTHYIQWCRHSGCANSTCAVVVVATGRIDTHDRQRYRPTNRNKAQF